MKVIDLKTGKTLEVSACYGARLLEQGKAKLVPRNIKKTAAKKAVMPDGTD